MVINAFCLKPAADFNSIKHFFGETMWLCKMYKFYASKFERA